MTQPIWFEIPAEYVVSRPFDDRVRGSHGSVFVKYQDVRAWAFAEQGRGPVVLLYLAPKGNEKHGDDVHICHDGPWVEQLLAYSTGPSGTWSA